MVHWRIIGILLESSKNASRVNIETMVLKLLTYVQQEWIKVADHLEWSKSHCLDQCQKLKVVVLKKEEKLYLGASYVMFVWSRIM